MKQIKPPLYFFGTKVRLAPWILEHFPEPEQYHTYVEPFGGMAAVLLAKPPVAEHLEVYNDINDDLLNFWDVLKDPKTASELLRALEYTPFSRAEFIRATKRFDLTGVERARLWLVLSQGANFAHRFTPEAGKRQWSAPLPDMRHTQSGKWFQVAKLTAECAARFRKVIVEREDWRYILERYDSPHTFFYVDPPYFIEDDNDRRGDAGGYYKKAGSSFFTDRDQLRLLDALCAVRGKVLLSGYDIGMYREVLYRWQKDSKDMTITGLKGKQMLRTETLWANYTWTSKTTPSP